MPVGFLSDAERQRLDSFPAQVLLGDIEAYFSLSPADRRQVPPTASAANRLGFALQLGTLRFLGFCPDDLSTAPEAVIAFVARQLDVAPRELARYGRRGGFAVSWAASRCQAWFFVSSFRGRFEKAASRCQVLFFCKR